MSEPFRQAGGPGAAAGAGQGADARTARRPHPGAEAEQARARESEAILRRIREETDPQIGASANRMATHAREHFAARDADQEVAIEVLGTRLGRWLALLVFLALAVSLVFQFARGS